MLNFQNICFNASLSLWSGFHYFGHQNFTGNPSEKKLVFKFAFSVFSAHFSKIMICDSGSKYNITFTFQLPGLIRANFILILERTLIKNCMEWL